MPASSSAEGRAVVAMIAMGLYTPLHAAFVALMLVAPWLLGASRWTPLVALAALYLVPPLLARMLGDGALTESTVAFGSPAFLRWWALGQLQMIFNRLPWLEELLRLVPGLYSAWLRLWGAQVGAMVFWSPGVSVVDRPLVQIGDRAVIGLGARLSSHTMRRDEQDRLTLVLAPIVVGREAHVGGLSTLAPGSRIADREIAPATLALHPFQEWSGGRRRARATTPAAAPARRTGLLTWIASRLRVLAREKIAVTSALTLFWCAWWVVIPRYLAGAAHALPLTAVEQRIPFVESAIYVYLSIAFYMPLAPLLAVSRAELTRHVWGFFGLTTVAFACFVLYPVQMPAPVTTPSTWLFGLVLSDTRLNNLPSLHAAYTIYSLLAWAHVLPQVPGRIARRLLALVITVWAATLLASILLLKQHSLIDMAAGVTLGLVTYVIAYHAGRVGHAAASAAPTRTDNFAGTPASEKGVTP